VTLHHRVNLHTTCV